MKVLLDEMLSPRIARELRRLGYDVTCVSEPDMLRRQPDPEIFRIAQAQGRAIATKNIQDFRPLCDAAIHRGDSHAGVILISNRRFPEPDQHTHGRLIQSLSAVLDQFESLTDREYWLT